MNKCYKCGLEFDGNFCPKCGTKYETTKNCPQCGADLDGSVNFCNNCGYCFNTHEKVTTKPSFEFGISFYKTVNKLLQWLPCVLFLIFAGLNFAFMGCSAYSAFGFEMSNIYKMSDADFAATATALIVLSAFSAAYVIVYPVLRVKRVKASHAIAFILYVLTIVLASVLYAQIKKGDWTVESGTKFMISFAIVFAALSAVSLIADNKLSKHSAKYIEAKTAMNDKSRPSFCDKVRYNVKTWYTAHKKAVKGTLIGVCSLAIICTLVFAVIVPLATNVFNANKLSKINIGDSKQQVSKILGKPDAGENGGVWQYYDAKAKKLIAKQEELNSQMENLTDLNQLGALMQEQAKLDKQLDELYFKILTVNFDSHEKVVGLTMNKNYNRKADPETKEIKKIVLGNKNVVDVTAIANDAVSVKTKYKDGSFTLTKLPSNAVLKETGSQNKNFPNNGRVVWTDGEQEFCIDVKFDESNYNFEWDISDDKLIVSGAIPNKRLLAFFDQSIPWSRSDFKFIRLEKDVSELTNIHDLFGDGDSFFGIEVDEDNPYYLSENNVIYTKDKTQVLYALNKEALSKTEYWNSLNDGLVYINGTLYGYKGEMPANFSLNIDDGTKYIASGAFYDYGNITSVKIPASVTYLAASAFMRCYNITNAALPADVLKQFPTDGLESVTIISGDTLPKANFGSSLTTISLPASLRVIDYDVFRYCYNLTRVDFAGTLSEWCTIEFWGPIDRFHDLYVNGKIVDKLVVPSDIDQISEYAFYYTKSLTSADMSNGVTVINREAFYGCKNLVDVKLSDNISSIGDAAFGYCNNLEYNVYDNAKYLGNDDKPYLVVVKAVDREIDSCEIHEDARIIMSNAFGSNYEGGTTCKIKSVNIGANVLEVGSYAFAGCRNLESVVLGKNLKSLGKDAFKWTYPYEVKYQGDINSWCSINFQSALSNPIYNASCFYIGEQKIVGNLVISKDLKINEYAFAGYNGIVSLSIEDENLLAYGAFYDCTSVLEVRLIQENYKYDNEESAKYFFDEYKESLRRVFNGNYGANENYFIPPNIVAYGQGKNLITTTDDGFVFYTSSNAEFLIKCVNDDTTVTLPSSFNNKQYVVWSYAFTQCDKMEYVDMPDNLMQLSDRSFYGCKSIKEVAIPKNIQAIGVEAFSRCASLKSVVMYDNIEYIFDHAFYNCPSLEKVTLSNNVMLDRYVFGECENLAVAEYDGAQYLGSADNPYYLLLKSPDYFSSGLHPDTVCISGYSFSDFRGSYVPIPEKVRFICHNAFNNAYRTSIIYIPQSVESIDYGAFMYTDIYHIEYGGTVEQWNNIEKTEGWQEKGGSDYSKIEKIVCVDGEISL